MFHGEQVSRLMFPNIDHLTANGKEFSLTLEMTMRESSPSHATFRHRPYIFAAKPPPSFLIPNFSFLIPHSRKAFIHNQWVEPPHGLTLNPSPFLYAIMKKRKGAFP